MSGKRRPLAIKISSCLSGLIGVIQYEGHWTEYCLFNVLFVISRLIKCFVCNWALKTPWFLNSIHSMQGQGVLLLSTMACGNMLIEATFNIKIPSFYFVILFGFFLSLCICRNWWNRRNDVRLKAKTQWSEPVDIRTVFKGKMMW